MRVTCSILECVRFLGTAESMDEALRLETEHLEADHGICTSCAHEVEECACPSTDPVEEDR